MGISAFKKIINPVMMIDRRIVNSVITTEKHYSTYVNIEWDGKKLSLSGVEGPMSNGDAHGACGQIVDEIANSKILSNGWTEEMRNKLVDIWKAWHLNDMRPYCEHQKELGWDKKGKQEVKIYHFRLTTEGFKKKREVENQALDALGKGISFTPTKEQSRIASLSYFFDGITDTLSGSMSQYYEPKKPLYQGDQGFVETKPLGWLYPTNHPEGLLTRSCPICGYKYGTAWKFEKVPDEVINWLYNLPESVREPAWC